MSASINFFIIITGMVEEEGGGGSSWMFGIAIVCFGLVSVFLIGIWSAMNPYQGIVQPANLSSDVLVERK